MRYFNKKIGTFLCAVCAMFFFMTPGVVQAATYTNSSEYIVVGENVYNTDVSCEYTIFEFAPSEKGLYTFTSNMVMGIVSYNGMWVTVEPSSSTVTENTLEWECTGVGQTIWIAVPSTTSKVSIEVVMGEVEEIVIPKITYENVALPEEFVFSGDASKLKYVSAKDDVTSTAVLGTDGFYHLDTVKGPKLYVSLADSKMDLSAANSYGQLRGVDIVDGQVVTVYDYTTAFAEYLNIADGVTVVGKTLAPLTEDLILILQNVGENPNNGWYDTENSLCVGTDEDAWMFLCCYVEGETQHEHSYVETVTAAACEKQGYTTYTCECGDSYVDNYVNATGHSYEETVEEQATVAKNGKIYTKCIHCGTVSKITRINKIDKNSIKLSTIKYTYNGSAKKPKVSIKDSKGNTLVQDQDYTLEYANGRKNTGKYTVKITFKGKYSGEEERTFKILPAATSKITVSNTTKTVKVTWKKVTGATGYRVQLLSASGKVLKTEYTSKLSYSFGGRKTATNYQVKVTAYKTIDNVRNFSLLSKTLKTSTAPAKTTLKAAAGTKKAVLSWDKVVCTGYEITYATNSSFSKANTVSVSKSSTVKKTISNLKKGKTYYFKIRAYKLVDGVKVYGSESKIVKAKIK